MSAPRQITIVGGGLAGLTLGIGLRQQGVPVTIWEAGQYPRHRVCGEFISGRGQQSLQRLGLLELITRAGTRPATTAAFHSTHKAHPARTLPQPALCVSRFVLDAVMAERFRDLSGELRCGARWPDKDFGEGIVRASGRRLQPLENGWRWFGLKAHATKVELTADLEMHLSANGYVGLCRLDGGEVNVCGLFRRWRKEPELRQGWTERLCGEPGSLLHQRLAAAEWEEGSFCSVAGLSLVPRDARESDECCVGDALTMIAPVTGNGMSLAFESAELALPALYAYACGKLDWNAAQRVIARRCDAAFRRRLRWANRVQSAMFHSPVGEVLLPLATRWGLLWTWLFRLTR